MSDDIRRAAQERVDAEHRQWWAQRLASGQVDQGTHADPNPYIVACPVCGALPGAYCLGPDTWTEGVGATVHRERWISAQAQLPEQPQEPDNTTAPDEEAPYMMDLTLPGDDESQPDGGPSEPAGTRGLDALRYYMSPDYTPPPVPPDPMRAYRGVVAQVVYRRADGIHTATDGILTTDHPASSRGLPVWVAATNQRTDDPIVSGQAYGPADLPEGYKMVIEPYHYLTDWACLSVAARSAGYNYTIHAG